MTEYLYLIGTTFFIVTHIPTLITFAKNVRDSFSTSSIGNTLSVYREIYNVASWKTMVEFCTFKIRLVLSRHFETGFLSGTPQNHSLVYYDGSKRYTIRFPKKRGPCTFSQVIFNDGDKAIDVTEKIREFSGPSHNFHGVHTTPKMLDYSNLTFTYRTGHVIAYGEDDVIST